MQSEGADPSAAPCPTASTPTWAGNASELYRAHVRSVHRYLRARVGYDLGEELTAQTFVEAWAQRDTYDPDRGTVQGWLHGIALNVMRHHFRQERRRARAHVALAAQRRLASLADVVEEEVSEALAAAERMALVDVALGRAERIDREVLLLAAQPGATYQGMADHLDVPIGTVRSRLNRARRRLAADIGSEPLS
ncbi:MAG TPA: RNA polymerase sigma factor [Acidimicrobiales bacterium]|nr:RNA polymerase sigma factor [Acidimicrobiales bacterium]